MHVFFLCYYPLSRTEFLLKVTEHESSYHLTNLPFGKVMSQHEDDFFILQEGFVVQAKFFLSKKCLHFKREDEIPAHGRQLHYSKKLSKNNDNKTNSGN